VSDAARERLEEMMKTSPFRSEFFENILDEGKAQGEAAALLKLLKSRGIGLTDEQHGFVTASSADDVFKD
jgi:hypothetical protein